MDKKLYEEFKEILRSELVPALGCTEPGAIACAAAEAGKLLKGETDSVEIWCSGNIIKNVKGVTVPNSGGMRGIEAAAALGILAGQSDAEKSKDLEILSSITQSQIAEAKEMIEKDICVCRLKEDTPNLYIKVIAKNKDHEVQVTVEESHTNLVSRVVDGRELSGEKGEKKDERAEKLKDHLTVREILAFADMMSAEDGKELFEEQVEYNTAIAEEGLNGDYGAKVGKTILKFREGCSVKTRAVAKAAAGSDARMNGCTMPVVINSGSGNQGITVTVPVAEYAAEMDIDRELLYKALAVSNLISIHIKHHIGKLSAFCGAVSASCGSAAAVAYLKGADYSKICRTISNTLGNVGGIVCDGAKASCAAKIASSLDAAFLGYDMAEDDLGFKPGEGFVEDDIEETIDNVGKIGRYGMKNTDKEILHLMLGHKDYICD